MDLGGTDDVSKIERTPANTTAPKAAKSLDELIEILDQDALRNVVGGTAARPKGRQAT